MFNGLDELEDFASRLAPLTPEEEEARQRTEATVTNSRSVITPIRSKVIKQAALKPVPTAFAAKKTAVPAPAPVSADKVVEIALSKAAGQTLDSLITPKDVSEFVGPLLPTGWPAEQAAARDAVNQPITEIPLVKARQVKARVVIDMTIPPETEKPYLKYALMTSGLMVAVMSAMLFF